MMHEPVTSRTPNGDQVVGCSAAPAEPLELPFVEPRQFGGRRLQRPGLINCGSRQVERRHRLRQQRVGQSRLLTPSGQKGAGVCLERDCLRGRRTDGTESLGGGIQIEFPESVRKPVAGAFHLLCHGRRRPKSARA